MTKARIKVLIFFAGLATLIPIALFGFRTIADFVSEFQRGANPASIFHGHTLIIPEEDQARWLVDSKDTGTVPSRVQRDEIIASYVQAWGALNHALESGNSDDLPTYWAGDPLIQAQESVKQNPKLLQTDRHHRLRLRFYSDDGSVVSIDDLNFFLTQTLNNKTDEIQVSASVVMTLDNGFWRIRLLNLKHLNN